MQHPRSVTLRVPSNLVRAACAVSALFAASCGSSSDSSLFTRSVDGSAGNGGSTGVGGGSSSAGGGTSLNGNGGATNGTGATGNGGGASSGGAVNGGGGSTTNGTGGQAANGGAASGGSGGTTGSGGSPDLDAGSGGLADAAGGPEAGSGTGGGKASGGTSGTGGTLGTGGKATGGSGGTGGVSSAGFVKCGDGAPCDTSKGFVCCLKSGVGGRTTTCTKDTSTCTNVFACDGSSDCTGGKKCCLDYTNSSSLTPDTACQTSCGNGGPMECTGPSDCPGKVCCGSGTAVGALGTLYESIVCQNTCTASMTFSAAYQLCDTSAVCGQGTTCLQSVQLPPGYRVCK